MEWMILPLRRYVDFTGRSRRTEFWMFQLLNLIVYAVIMAIFFAGFPWEFMDAAAGTPPAELQDPDDVFGLFGPLFWIGMGLAVIWGLGTFIPHLAVTVRRLHDRGMSGWWYGGLLLFSFIPFIGGLAILGYLVIFVIMLLPGEPGPNRWGPDPRDPGQAHVFD